MTLKHHVIFATGFLICVGGVPAYEYATSPAYPHGAPPEPRVPRLAQLFIAGTFVYAVPRLALRLRSSQSAMD